MSTIGTRILELRKDLKLTQGQVGAKTGVSGVAVGYWEKDMHTPKGETLTKLAKVLRTTPDYIITGKSVKLADTSLPYPPGDISPSTEEIVRAFALVPDDMKSAALKMIQALQAIETQNSK